VVVVIGRQTLAILWAQWRSMINYNGRSSRDRRFPFALVFGIIWYGMWAFLAFGVMRIAADPSDLSLLRRAGPGSMLVIFIYWQIVPIILVSTGLSLDLNRLVVYPIQHASLFGIEVMLRITTCLEMVLILVGLMAGLSINPRVPIWAPMAIVVFGIFNLLVSTSVRDLLTRLLARKGYRELMVIGLVLLAALPQAVMMGGPPEKLRALIQPATSWATPWGATARIMTGSPDLVALAILIGFTGLAWLVGRSQFERSLRFDSAAARSAESAATGRFRVLERAMRLPLMLFRDPLAALVEKEARVLTRSARFRLLFLMGFSFGLIIWLPLAMRNDPDSLLRTNYLTIVSAYALMLLGEICFWNNLGMDRSAAQTYFVMPLDFSTVLIAKNLTAAFFIFFEIVTIAFFCAVLRMPVTAASITETLAVTAVLTIFLLAAGNMISTRYPRPVDPGQSWRSGSMGRVQAYLLLLYPIASAPIFLAYGARYAFDSELAFYAVLALNLVIGLVVYAISLESSVAAAEQRKEDMIMALSSTRGPVGS
jgi:ABC-2 type transport system permease protein